MDSAPGVDVRAHVHGNGEEMFYVIDGELDHLMTMGRERRAAGSTPCAPPCVPDPAATPAP